MELRVTVQIDGVDVYAGKLLQNVRNGNETTTFSYDSAYLDNPRAFALAPDMPLVAGPFHSEGLTGFRAFEDCMPGRWGRNLMLRAERTAARSESRAAKTLFETNMLAGVSDETRQGAMRIWTPDGTAALAPEESGVPREVSVPELISAADAFSTDVTADIRDLLAAGSSLGGARPKASVRNEQGELLIAKFPKVEEGALEDVGAWEHVCLQLMERCGIDVPSSRLIRVGGRSVLLLRRFDRVGAQRIPYISGVTAIQGEDGGHYSYLDLVEFLEDSGASPEADIRQLWLRALFSCAVGNTDNHMRNHGFLRESDGWRLSPAFDVNPTPGTEPKYLNTAIDFENRSASPELAVSMCEYFRLSRAEARRQARVMARELASWRRLAVSDSIARQSIELMEGCFESGIERLRKV